MKACFVICVALGLSSLVPRAAQAEEYLMDGNFGLGTGLEGGDPGTGLAWRRARLRVLAGIDLRSDEAESDALGFRGFVEIEQRATLGAEVRYEKWMARNFAVWGGLTGTIAPETLFGFGVGATAVIPFGRRVGLFIEPSFSALPLGSDTPGNSVLVWGLLAAGVRFSL